MKTPKTVGVIGAGTMGRGIVQWLAQAGHAVLCFDAMEGAAQKGVAYVNDMMARAVEKGRMTAAAAAEVAACMRACPNIEALEACDLVIEAIVEDLAAKRAMFAMLEAVLRPDAILASNTSSLTVADIAAACRHPERVAGLHFFNPVPLMKVVEIIAAVRTSPAVVEQLRALVAATGHRAVVAQDQPGFLVNHAGRGLYTEGLRIVEDHVATVEEVDTLLREAAGFRMGPFELLDLTGLDVSGKVMESIYAQFHQEPRFRPSALVPPRIAAGLLGRKTDEGWYRYRDGQKIVSAPRAVPVPEAGLAVWIDEEAADRAALSAIVGAAGATLAADPSDDCLLVVQPWGHDVSSVCAARGLDPLRCVGVDPLPGLDRHRTLMLSAVTAPRWRDAACAMLATDGVAVTVIGDSPGFVVQRVLAVIVNIAANIAQRRIASVQDLEDAVRLGLGYPFGPLGWGDRLGANRILEILHKLQAATGDPRYRPSPWLARRAALGLSLLAPEAERHAA
ncbi:3-hydroxyadipyl-CoA dehydrogenase (plasmid) [Variovorax sp. SRS16]|uniref:3-hydroxyacyl-CoA dehydrogenase n=1 Tax=Variovorax sp. SRS16 TaxID=282217 RepID=UPI001316D0AB|nr:3-hydroxyacyl-CoA dehydrogenase [Variovorax sp. SRS16]VTU45559.1 3-hydroxyadipyl-CoA dehydrogenase [Variovorax sp. SRS16]